MGEAGVHLWLQAGGCCELRWCGPRGAAPAPGGGCLAAGTLSCLAGGWASALDALSGCPGLQEPDLDLPNAPQQPLEEDLGLPALAQRT